MSSLKLSMGDSIKGLQAGDRRPSWCSLPATSRTSPQTRGSGHDHGSASAPSAWNQQPTTVTTIARIATRNGAEFSHDRWAPQRKHDRHGRNHNLSRLQVKAAGANSEKPTAARAVRDDGFPGSFRGTYPANQTWRLDFRSSAGRLAARQMELGRVRGAPSDDDQEGYSLRYQMVETRYDLARRDIRRFIEGGRPQGATRFLHHGSLRRGLHNKRPRRGSHWESGDDRDPV